MMMTGGTTRPVLPSVYVNALQNTKMPLSQPHINYVFQEIRFGSIMQLYPYHTYYILHNIFDLFIILTHVYGET